MYCDMAFFPLFKDEEMSIRQTLSPLYFLPVLLGAALWISGCGAPSPDDIIIAGDSNLPTLQLISLNDASAGPALVGIGNSYDIRWRIIGKLSSPVVKIFLKDPDSDTAIEITPAEGVAGDANVFKFTPAKGLAKTAFDYQILARLYAGGSLFDTRTAVQMLRIGDGGINITAPSQNITLARGLPIDVTWTLTNNICQELPDKAKYVHLYIDTIPEYKAGSAVLVSGEDEDIEGCQGTYTIKTGEIPGLRFDTPYYIIARLYIDGLEASRAASPGTFQVTPSLVVTAPVGEITSNLQAVPVAWEVIGRSAAGLKVEFLAKIANDDEDDVIRVVSQEYSAEQGTGLADASKLPTGTYNVVVRLFERDTTGAKVILDTATSSGRIIIPNGYNGSFDLSEMAAIKTRNYSPIDGAIFEGFNIDEQLGFEVAGVGDINADKFSDFMIFSRFDQQYTTGNSGGAYLIRGQETFTPIINVNSIGSPNEETRLVNGTILLFPMENLATMNPGTGIPYGGYTAIGLPDVSNDGAGDILIGCPDAAPLRFYYINDAPGDITFIDHYGLERIIPLGNIGIEPSHVPPGFYAQYPKDFAYSANFGSSTTSNYQYLPGDTIEVRFIDSSLPAIVTIHHLRQKRGATYLLPSQRLNAQEYQNKVYDLCKVGSPVEDGVNEPAGGWNDRHVLYRQGISERSEMITWDSAYDDLGGGSPVQSDFGAYLSVMGDINGDSYPEFLISVPSSYARDSASTSSSPDRAAAGIVKFLGSAYRHTSLNSLNGTISWMYPQWEFNLRLNGTTVNSDGIDYALDIIGAEAGSRLTGAAGLGRFSSVGNFGGAYVNGDYNGDLVPDLVVGAPGENSEAGCVYVVPVRSIFGRRDSLIDLADFNKQIPVGPTPSLEVPILGVKVQGTLAGEQLGQIVKPAGDFNGDGLADVMFATPTADAGGKIQAGRVFIMFGQKNQIGDFTLEDVDSHMGTQLPALIFEGQNDNDNFGMRIVAVYDVNGDGLDDILVAAPNADAPSKTDCGKIYLIYGKKNIIKTNPLLPAGLNTFVDYNDDGVDDDFWNVQKIGVELPGAVFIGETTNSHLQAIAPAGDVNGDGIGDFVIGSPNTDVNAVQTNAGKAYLIFGRKFVLPN